MRGFAWKQQKIRRPNNTALTMEKLRFGLCIQTIVTIHLRVPGHRLTPQQLSTHVERNTVVAQWLERRLGWRRLLQACVSQEPHDWTTPEDFVDKHAA
jgi:hypothetical protein